MKVKSLSRVQLPVTPWTAAYQAPPSMGFSRQEYWSGVPLPLRDSAAALPIATAWRYSRSKCTGLGSAFLVAVVLSFSRKKFSASLVADLGSAWEG